MLGNTEHSVCRETPLKHTNDCKLTQWSQGQIHV